MGDRFPWRGNADANTRCECSQDIKPRHIHQYKRPHREPEVDRRLVDRRRRRPLFQQPERLLNVGDKHAGHQEPLARGDQHRSLAKRLGPTDRRRQNLRWRGVAPDNLHQRHAVSRIEKVHADQPLRMPHSRGQLVQGDRRRIGGEDGVGRANGFQVVDDRPLHIDVFEHRFDHQIRPRATSSQRVVVDSSVSVCSARGSESFPWATRFWSESRILLGSLRQGRLALIQHHNGHTGQDQCLRDVRAHRPHANDRGLGYRSGLSAPASSGILLVSLVAKNR